MASWRIGTPFFRRAPHGLSFAFLRCFLSLTVIPLTLDWRLRLLRGRRREAARPDGGPVVLFLPDEDVQ